MHALRYSDMGCAWLGQGCCTEARADCLASGAAHAVLKFLFFCSLQVSVDVVLQLPSDHLDLFQVTGELLANATLVTAKSTRTHINAPQPYAYKLARCAQLLCTVMSSVRPAPTPLGNISTSYPN